MQKPTDLGGQPLGTPHRQALEDAGVDFVAESGEGPGVRLKKAK